MIVSPQSFSGPGEQSQLSQPFPNRAAPSLLTLGWLQQLQALAVPCAPQGSSEGAQGHSPNPFPAALAGGSAQRFISPCPALTHHLTLHLCIPSLD